MPILPYIPGDDHPEIEITVNSKNNTLYEVTKADVHYEFNKIPFAKLWLISSNPNIENNAEDSGDNEMAVTDEIEILIKEGPEKKSLFKGIIFSIEKNLDSESGILTRVECKDPCNYLLGQQENIPDESFEDKMSRFLSHLSIANEIDLKSWGTEVVSKTSNTSPWDYLVGFLDSLGLMTTIRKGTFRVFNSTEKNPEPTFSATNGTNLLEFHGSEEGSVAKVILQYWDVETQKVQIRESDTEATNGQGVENISMNGSNYRIETLDQMSKARAAKNRLATVKGKCKTFGNLQVQYGDYLIFEKVNHRIDGKAMVISSEHHYIENGCWQTEYGFGLEDNKSFIESIKSSTTSNEERLGQTNTMNGLQLGIVTDLEDPQNQFRVKVRIPAISHNGEGVWARLSSLQAGSGRGAVFVPEIGDEVIIGCFNNNPDTPVIIGKLFSSANPPPFPIKSENYVQGLVSKEGSRIVVNDEDKSVEISTPNGNKVFVSDDEIKMEDQNGNRVNLDSGGITMESQSNLTLKAAGKIQIEGAENAIKATGNMKLNGALIQLN